MTVSKLTSILLALPVLALLVMLSPGQAAAATITVTGMTATASSKWQEGSPHTTSYEADYIVDGSGLNYGGVPGAHDTAGRYTMWLSGSSKPQYAGDTDPYVVFDLGGKFNLQGVRIWNYNETTKRGVKGLDIKGSPDGGTYALMKTVELNEGPDSNLYDFSQTFSGLNNASDVRYVQFDILSNHNAAVFPTDGPGGSAGNNGYGFAALSEVQFDVEVPLITGVSATASSDWENWDVSNTELSQFS